MVYLILAEARSGGSHLMDYLGTSYPHFALAQEPMTGAPNKFTESKDFSKLDWIDDKEGEGIFIREIYQPETNLEPLMNRSDKIICLYRKNWYAQIRSILFTRIKNEIWSWSYTREEMQKLVTEDEILKTYYNGHKYYKNLFQKFIRKNNLFSISYEELYHEKDSIKKIMNHFNLHSEFDFPLYQRHMKENDNKTPVGFEEPPQEITDFIELKKYIDNKDSLIDSLVSLLENEKSINRQLSNELEILKKK